MFRTEQTFGELGCLRAFLKGFRTLLMVKRVEIEVPIVVLLTVRCAGGVIMMLNRECRIVMVGDERREPEGEHH